jgi:hypothetical protein
MGENLTPCRKVKLSPEPSAVSLAYALPDAHPLTNGFDIVVIAERTYVCGNLDFSRLQISRDLKCNRKRRPRVGVRYEPAVGAMHEASIIGRQAGKTILDFI